MAKTQDKKAPRRPHANHTNHTPRGAKKAAKTISKRIRSGKKRFLNELRKCGNAVIAAERAGLGRKTVYEWRTADAAFAEAWEEKRLAARESLRASMHERAMADTTLAIFLAKGYWPEEFRERFEINLRNDPQIRALVAGFAQVLEEFVPKEKLRSAVLRFFNLAGYNGPLGGAHEPPMDGSRSGLPDPTNTAKS